MANKGRNQKWRRRWSPWSLRRQVATWQAQYDEVWTDHLNRCGCHDAWDQCEHSASGRHAKGCGCCVWC